MHDGGEDCYGSIITEIIKIYLIVSLNPGYSMYVYSQI
jgi:hypothetical protein